MSHLTESQIVILKAAITAETNPTFIALRDAGATGAMADWYNEPVTPAFTLWKLAVPIAKVGVAFNSSELAGLTTANTNRLQVMASFSGGNFDPSAADVRAGLDAVFAGAGGVLTRAALLALWKRQASRGEKLFATGVGSDASPAKPNFEGDIDNEDIVRAIA